MRRTPGPPLHRFLTEDQIALCIRIAASLVLLHAQPVSRLVRLTTRVAIDDNGEVSLRLGSPPTPVPRRRHCVITDDVGLTGRIGQAVLGGLLPPRRPRVSARKVKSPLSRWNKTDLHRPRVQHPGHRSDRHRQRPPDDGPIRDTPRKS